MGKVGFVFPGQGSQFVGMLRELYEAFAVVRDTFAEADAALGYSISTLCFEGPEEALMLTANTQPAILTASVAVARILADKGIKPDMAAGHSLGEYSALVAVGALSFADAVRLVHKRGQYMQEAVPVGEGSMAAVMGLDNETIKSICAEVTAECGKAVEAVNFNCPSQVAIAGAKEAVVAAIARLKERGAKRAVELAVSAPFHSSLMGPAAQKLAQDLRKINFQQAAVPVIANVSATPVVEPEEIVDHLIAQTNHAVLWEDSIKYMISSGVDTFVEVGAGKVLTGLIKRIDRKKTLLNVEDLASLEKTLAKLTEVR